MKRESKTETVLNPQSFITEDRVPIAVRFFSFYQHINHSSEEIVTRVKEEVVVAFLIIP